jgi:hypothetical protein
MGDKLSAERACKDPSPIIDGRKANVNFEILCAKPTNAAKEDDISYVFINNQISNNNNNN